MKNAYTARTQELIEFDNRLRHQISLSNKGKLLCGVDEAGRGPLAGPVVAAAVIFSDDVYIEGVFDSKRLTHRQREALYDEIIEHAGSFGVGIIESSEIDEINILEATRRAMNKAIEKLKIKPALIAADGNFYKSTAAQVENFIKGDGRSFSIAAASIVAKVTRDRIMAQYEKDYPHFSFSAHKGYGTRKHLDEILEHGYTSIHRRSFRVKSFQGVLF